MVIVITVKDTVEGGEGTVEGVRVRPRVESGLRYDVVYLNYFISLTHIIVFQLLFVSKWLVIIYSLVCLF